MKISFIKKFHHIASHNEPVRWGMTNSARPIGFAAEEGASRTRYYDLLLFMIYIKKIKNNFKVARIKNNIKEARKVKKFILQIYGDYVYYTLKNICRKASIIKMLQIKKSWSGLFKGYFYLNWPLKKIV